MSHLLSHGLSYAGMFVLLAGSGLIAPVPEEVTLLTAGYFIALGFMDPFRGAALAILALLAGDGVLFALSKFGHHYARKIHDRLIAAGLAATWVFDPERPLRAVFIMRFFTGIRMIAPIFAGFNGASAIGFFAVDFAALVIFVPAMLFLGHHFSGHFVSFLAGFEFVRHIVFWTLIVLLGGSVLAAMNPRLHRVVHRIRHERSPGHD